MINNRFTARLKKVKGKLIHITEAEQNLYDLYKKNLPEGSTVELFIQEVTEDGSLSQLAKVHAMIRDLSQHTGNTFEEMKLEVKKRSGLVISIPGDAPVVKSFGNCSYEELSHAIQAAIEIGELVNYPVS